MDLDLLHLENKAYNSSFALLDWQLISESILKYVHLACQKEQGLHSIIGASPDNFSFKQRQHIINQYYSFLEFLLNVVFPNNEGEMVQCLQALPNDEDLEVLLSHLDKGGQLSIEELNFVAILIENGSDLFKLFNNSPQLECFRFSDNFFKDLFKRFLLPFRRLVDTDGNIDYSRHSTLGPLYNEVISLEGRLRDYLNTLANNSSLSNKLQFKGHDIINDYYVLAIKSDSYHSSIGRIRARSETGQTLYVEPHGAKELSRQRIELLARIDAEISRIGREFAKSLKEAVPQLKILWQFICEIDIQNAKARYIREKQLTKPTFSDNSNWEMIDFFHPLIPNPIVNSIKLTNHDGLIISGPNTGGKTVALKALALSQLFIHYGLFTPCTHAKLPIYTSLFYLGNDQQAIDKGLSSFSSEVINYHYVLENLTNSNLIIIDEIFNSTSSEEASALALGLFEEIHRRSNATILVSTHHQMLKTIMHKNKNYLSAHVGFDLEAQLPTFKLHLDTPGSSLALTIFKRLCKDLFNVDKILTKAQNTLDTRTLTYEKLLQELSQKESKLDKLISENAQLQKELKNQKKSQQGLLQLAREQELQQYRNKLDSYIVKAQNLISNFQETSFHPKQAKRKINELKHSFAIEEDQNLQKNEKSIEYELEDNSPNSISIGEKLYALPVKAIVKVINIDKRKKTATVNIGKMNIQLSFNQLRKPKNFKSEVVFRNEVKVNIVEGDDASDEKIHFDARGMRADEFLTEIDKRLGYINTKKIPYLEVIHGHGEGILKKLLRSHLKKYGYNWTASEDDGITIIKD